MANYSELGFEEPKKEDYKSPLGDYNFTQAKLLLFGKSKKMMIFMCLQMMILLTNIISFIILMKIDYSFIDPISNQVTNFNFIKIFLVIVVVISLIIPISTALIYIGSTKLNMTILNRGIKIVKKYLQISRYLFVVGMILISISFILGLRSNIVIVFIFLFILGGFAYIYYRFLTLGIDFLEESERGLNGQSENLPDPSSLTNFFIVFLVLAVINLISAFVTSGGIYANGFESFNILAEQMQGLETIQRISSTLGVINLVLTLIMINSFSEM
ncbi:hypothetical protein RJI07_03805 [Mycoplasmatota bacterium WC30]